MTKIVVTKPMQSDFIAALRAVGLRISREYPDREQVCGTLRSPHLVELRRRVAVILRAKGYSLNEIGTMLGGKDHATVANWLHSKPRDPRDWVWYPDLGVWKPKPLPGRRAFENLP